ncbi:23S rRNA (uracil(1939)-C(5))-methyltransferase RlmD [Telmatobacter sp. DSM 110680]|uniref:23S rRNA (Uracil(1939)-C(5))-methyltransferase RlmD n=1 Tax=Telmatobacter sp. DSM 110680 TaxID=3036704 RepID=A0AAU7DM82_9BACT
MKRRPQKARNSAPPRSAHVQIEKPIYGGAFLARVDGKATFIPLTLPGEQARVRIVEEKHGYAVGEPEEIVVTAANRVMPACRHFGACGGCQYQHTDYASQLEFKQAILRETFERGGVTAPEKIDVLAANPWQYRNRIRLAFDNAGRMGYRARRSHDLVPISECPIAAPLLVSAALTLADNLREQRLRAMEVSLFCNAEETELLASIFVRDSATRGLDQLFEKWKQRVPALTGVELVNEGGVGQASRIIARAGAASMSYRANGVNYRVDHGSFFQVNRWLVDTLVDRVVANRRGDLAWDLFAGVGLFACSLQKQFKQVIAVESAPTAMEALTQNLYGSTGRSVNAETLAFLKGQSSGAKPDLIVVDPPRAGLGLETASLLAGIEAPVIVYVSCDPATLARDLRTLIGSGYALSSTTLADLFPQTFHLESVVELRRA